MDIDDIPLEISLREEIGLVTNLEDLTTSLINSLIVVIVNIIP